MIHRFKHEWRMVSILSATFLWSVFFMSSCKKKDTFIGSSGLDEAALLAAGAIDTFTLETYSILDDSINTTNPTFNVLGEMNDPVFGKIKTSFYTQVLLEAGNPDFGDTNDIIMDSMVLAMQFNHYTGKLTPQKFEVYEVDEAFSADDSAYYEFDSLDLKPGNLVAPGQGTITPEPIADAIIDTESVQPQLRIPLDTNFGRKLIVEAMSGGTNFSNNDNFLNYFKGIYVTTNNAPQASGQGGVFGFNMRSSNSKITLYFRRWEIVNGTPTLVKKRYDFVINATSKSFNRAQFDRTGSLVKQVLDDHSKGLVSFYAQAFGTRAVINIPGLSNISKKAVIQKAILFLPVQYQTGSAYSVGSSVNMFFKESVSSNNASVLFLTPPPISDFTKSVTQDISASVQKIVSGVIKNQPIYIAPERSATSGDRIIFNGPNTGNKKKPKLYIIYTEY